MERLAQRRLVVDPECLRTQLAPAPRRVQRAARRRRAPRPRDRWRRGTAALCRVGKSACAAHLCGARHGPGALPLVRATVRRAGMTDDRRFVERVLVARWTLRIL